MSDISGTSEDVPKDELVGADIDQMNFHIAIQDNQPIGAIWGPNEEFLLEVAMEEVPKEAVNRWAEIASRFPGRSTEEIIARGIDLEKNKELNLEVAMSGLPAQGPEMAIWGPDEEFILEVAMEEFPKEAVNRWAEIASRFPGRSMEEIIARVIDLEKNEEINLEAAMSTLPTQGLEMAIWGPNEEFILEVAMEEVPKEVVNRWAEIASRFPGRSVDEIIARAIDLEKNKNVNHEAGPSTLPAQAPARPLWSNDDDLIITVTLKNMAVHMRGRWDMIASYLGGRPVSDILVHAVDLGFFEDVYMHFRTVTGPSIQELDRFVSSLPVSAPWTSYDDAALQSALTAVPAGDGIAQRWGTIAAMMNGRSLCDVFARAMVLGLEI